MTDRTKSKGAELISMVYWHSEGGGKSDRGILVNSANLIDFFVSLHGADCDLHVIAPAIDTSRAQLLDRSADVAFTSAPGISGSRRNSIIGAIRTLFFLFVGDGRKLSKSYDASVSVALSGFGTLVALRRVFIDRRPHSFIIRGNRLKTVGSSSRPYFSKNFALLRIRIYLWILIHSIRSGRAQVWFQGGGYKNELAEMVPKNFHSKLHVLDAVLRDLPVVDKRPDKVFDLVYLGRLTVEKGLLELVESIRVFKEKGVLLSANLVGDGPDRPKIEAAISLAGVESQIQLNGFVSDKNAICNHLLQGRIFVLPSYTEGLPRSLLEAAALGVSLVSTPVGGIPLVFQHKVSAMLIDVASVDSLVEAIEYLLNDKNQQNIENMISNAKSIAKKHSFEKRGSYFLENIVAT